MFGLNFNIINRATFGYTRGSGLLCFVISLRLGDGLCHNLLVWLWAGALGPVDAGDGLVPRFNARIKNVLCEYLHLPKT